MRVLVIGGIGGFRVIPLLLAGGVLAFTTSAESQAPPADAVPTSIGHVPTPDGVQLHYQVRGSGPDTLVVLHGGPGLSSAYLAPDLDLLAGTHTLIHYDQRGSGRSTVVTDADRLRLANHVADVEAVREHFELERLVLLGHSWGAALAAHYARAHPDRVEKLILVGAMPPRSTPYMEEFGENLYAWMDDEQQARIQELSEARHTADDVESACRSFWGLFIRGYFTDPHDPAGPARMRGDVCDAPPEALRNGGVVSAAVMEPFGDWDWRADFGDVDRPVLVLHGETDPIPVASAAEWQGAFADAELVVIPAAGHFPHVEEPAAFREAVEAFLR